MQVLNYRAYRAATAVVVLVVSSLGPSASSAATLIRGLTTPVCVASPCNVLAAMGGVAQPGYALPPGTQVDAATLPPGTLPPGTALPGTALSGTALPAGPPAQGALPVSTVTSLPASTAATGSGARGDSGAAVSSPAVTLSGTGGTTAAQTLGWGAPSRVENFDAGLSAWGVYDGRGHDGQGRRSPAAATVANGFLTIDGDARGTTAGMAWNFGARYGRWEVRMRAPAADPSYHAVSLLWPDSGIWPKDGEVDFAEMSDAARRTTDAFLHYGSSNSQVSGSVRIDAAQWHNWAVEWTPSGIATYVDGQRWWSTTDTAILPPGPMHLCLQLDWFPEGAAVAPSQMNVDWAAFYPVQGSGTGVAPANSAGSPAVAPPVVPSPTPVVPPVTRTAVGASPTATPTATAVPSPTAPPTSTTPTLTAVPTGAPGGTPGASATATPVTATP